MHLVVDDREHALINRVDLNGAKYEIKIDRIEIGDYCVLQDEQVVICIERKTWKDLGQSFKDGRKKNIDKMLSLREKTGCFLFYLIEGLPFHSPTRRFSGIEFKNLQAHLDHCQFKDQISIIYCKNLDGVIPRIVELMDNYRTFHPSKVGGARNAHLLKERTPETEQDMSVDFWMCLSGVSTKTAELLVKNGITIKSVFLGRVSKSDIAALKYENGNSLGEKRASALCEGVRNNGTAILSRIRGISKARAEAILRICSFEDILNRVFTSEQIANIEYSGRRLGDKLAEKIERFLVNDYAMNANSSSTTIEGGEDPPAIV